MEKLTITLHKNVLYVIYIIGILTLFNFFRGCSTNKEDGRMRKQVEALTNEIDTLRETTYSKKEQDIVFRIEGYRISKRVLYDENAIVRTILRPDDRMNEYDQEIEKLQKELEDLHAKE